MPFTMEEVIAARELRDQNPHWRNGTVSQKIQEKSTQRFTAFQLVKSLFKRQ